MQEHGLVAIVKRNCPTCVLVAPVLQEILQHSDLKIYTQDDPSFPEGIEGVADDTSLDVSYRLDVEIVPTWCGSKMASRSTAPMVGIERPGKRWSAPMAWARSCRPLSPVAVP